MNSTTTPAENPNFMVLLPRADRFLTGQRQPVRPALAGWLTECTKEQMQ